MLGVLPTVPSRRAKSESISNLFGCSWSTAILLLGPVWGHLSVFHRRHQTIVWSIVVRDKKEKEERPHPEPPRDRPATDQERSSGRRARRMKTAAPRRTGYPAGE